MEPSALAAAAAQARSMETVPPLAMPDEAIRGTVGRRSQHAPHPIVANTQLYNSCGKTTLQGDTAMKTGMHGLTPMPTTVPADQHVTGAMDATEASLAHSMRDTSLQGASDTNLQGACAMRSGIYHGERANAIAMIMAGSLGTSERC